MAEHPAATSRARLAEPSLPQFARVAPPAYAMRYVEFNPVRAEMVQLALDYPWPSAKAHAGLVGAPEWLETRGWRAEPSDSRASEQGMIRRGDSRDLWWDGVWWAL